MGGLTKKKNRASEKYKEEKIALNLFKKWKICGFKRGGEKSAFWQLSRQQPEIRDKHRNTITKKRRCKRPGTRRTASMKKKVIGEDFKGCYVL